MVFILFPNTLFDIKYLDKSKTYVLYEHPLFFSHKCRSLLYHKNKLILHRASMQYYYDYLKKRNFIIEYIKFNENPPKNITEMFDPVDKILEKQFQNIIVHKSPMFLHSKDDLEEYSGKLFHNSFKLWSINRLGLKGMDKSYDINNRSKLVELPVIIHYNVGSSKFVEEAESYVNKNFKTYGNNTKFVYPITHKHAKQLLDHFLKNKLINFGKYQDAILSEDDLILYHSFLSSSLNIGLITPDDVIKATLKVKDKVPIESYEGFLRQIVGWREYMRYIYIYHYDTMIKSNHFKNKIKLPVEWYHDDFKTGILPIDNCLEKVKKYGYLHHIERLMILLNYMTLKEYNPSDIYKWFLSCVSIDAYDWVMVTNIYIFSYAWKPASRKPYLSSSNYILKMSNYKRDTWCDEWDKLYNNFLKKKKNELRGTLYYKR
jgi:deoxyribodipyrimidine photolyase-related protein